MVYGLFYSVPVSLKGYVWFFLINGFLWCSIGSESYIWSHGVPGGLGNGLLYGVQLGLGIIYGLRAFLLCSCMFGGFQGDTWFIGCFMVIMWFMVATYGLWAV